MPEKVRTKEELKELKGIIRNYWVFAGYSIRKIADEFNSNSEYVKKFGTVSVASVGVYVKEIRRELENWLDEDALEKYTGEFVRKQYIIDEQIEKLRKAQNMIDVEGGDVKDKELYLKFERAIHEMHMNQIKMMSEIELVLRIKKLNKEQRLKNETLVLIEEDNKTAKHRGYLPQSDQKALSLVENSDNNDEKKP